MEHSGRTIGIYEGGKGVWDKGGHANPVPFAMSSGGYGVFRNTFAPGEYQFHKSGGATLSHGELGADAFIFVAAEEAGGMKEVLGQFLQVTGRPVVPPVWALSLGDSDCYNNVRHGHSTEKSALTIEDQYAETDVRDLQWKTFLPVAMTMSGWSPQVAGAQKQPWAFGDPYTSFNRESLRLRHAITPYMYS